jgi:hypothetical protein
MYPRRTRRSSLAGQQAVEELPCVESPREEKRERRPQEMQMPPLTPICPSFQNSTALLSPL